MESIIKQYAVAVRHDTGNVTIRTAALNPERAVQTVIAAEGCPVHAIISVTEVMLNGGSTLNNIK